LSKSEKPKLINSMVQLPPQAERQIVGNWLISEPGMHMTRSIELVEGEYFLVSRLLGKAGEQIGGDQGLRLVKVSEFEFRGCPPNIMVYTINSNGELLCQAPLEKEVSLHGVPQSELWPQ
jgi:hypothetical protein